MIRPPPGKGNLSSDGYQVTGDGAGTATLNCRRCGGRGRIKSNKAIIEEFERQRKYLGGPSPVQCPNAACVNHQFSGGLAEIEARFRRFGTTDVGSMRWQCRACRKTVSVGGPTLRQRKSFRNVDVFKHLVNKGVPSRLMETLDLGPSAFYGKIDFLYRQCQLFAASREARLPYKEFEHLRLCTDRQVYLVNWPNRKIRLHILIQGIATAELKSGYVFGLTPAYDPSINLEELEAAREACGDRTRAAHLQEYARLWSRDDYTRQVAKLKKDQVELPQGSAPDSETPPAPERSDLDGNTEVADNEQLPAKGVLVHSEYTGHGHFHLLRHLLRGAKKVSFHMDDDPALMMACLGAFTDRVRDRTADILSVRILKDMKVDVRRRLLRDARKRFEAAKLSFPGLSDYGAKVAIMTEKVRDLRAESPVEHKKLQDLWIDQIFPNPAEPDKRVRFVTDLDDYDDETVARMLISASLWPIDTVFNQIRRRLVIAERGIMSHRQPLTWHINAPYNPIYLVKVLEIFRVWNNFIGPPKSKKPTPAQRLGLTKGKVRYEDIVYFDVREYLKPS